jgi:hypothetical protein
MLGLRSSPFSPVSPSISADETERVENVGGFADTQRRFLDFHKCLVQSDVRRQRFVSPETPSRSRTI